MNTVVSKISMVDLKSQYEKIKPEIDHAIKNVIDSTAFINGKPVADFAVSLAAYFGVKHVIPCANGTDAIQIALMAMDLEPGDEVITTPFTFIATAEVINLLRLKPVFVDVYNDTFNLDINKIESAITTKTKCIIPVHLYGLPCDMEPLMEIANKHGIKVIEDVAQAIGADYQFKNGTKFKAGAIGDIGTTSFFPSKNLGCYGDGGAITTNDDQYAERIKMIVNHGSKERYYHDVVGVNSRLDSIQAAILNVKLKYLNKYIDARQKAAAYYNDAFKNNDLLTTPVISSNSTHVFHQYTLKVKSGRNKLKEMLEKEDIPSMIYYPVPLHLQKAYAYCGYKKGDFPISEKLAEEVLSLPMHTELDNSQLEYITTNVNKFSL